MAGLSRDHDKGCDKTRKSHSHSLLYTISNLLYIKYNHHLLLHNVVLSPSWRPRRDAPKDYYTPSYKDWQDNCWQQMTSQVFHIRCSVVLLVTMGCVCE